MDKKLKSALKQNFIPPTPQKKDAFLNSIAYPKAKFSEVLFSQISFIRKRVWFLFFALVLFAFFTVNFSKTPANIIATISAILPIFVLLSVSEIYKSCRFKMSEIELSCKYNLQKITLMRLGILGIVSFFMLIIFTAFAGKNGYGFMRNAVYLAVPFLLSSYLSLLIIAKFKAKDTILVVAFVCGAVSFLTVLISDSYKFIYEINLANLWAVVAVALAVLLIFTLLKFIKSQEELQWNFA